MSQYHHQDRLAVAAPLQELLSDSLFAEVEVNPSEFWAGFQQLLLDLIPQNAALLAERERLQLALDDYAKTHKDHFDAAHYQSFLTDIGYLQPQPEQVAIQTENVDAEIATMAGPQLVVPINNARYALNAANARWGSLYDALYGTDVIDETDGAEKTSGYNPVRGQKVVAYAKAQLDQIIPVQQGSHSEVQQYTIHNGELQITLTENRTTQLKNPQQWRGYQGSSDNPSALLFVHNGLHLEVQIDPQHPVGANDPAGVKDVLLEAALSTIMDCEDSVAAVDAEDKALVYANWLGLMRSDLQETLRKNGKNLTRRLAADREYQDPQGQAFSLPGRSRLFIRNVGHLMETDAVLLDGKPIPEGILDGVITSLIAKLDILGKGQFRNSQRGSAYIVKPKMHGPDEVAFSAQLFGRIEQLLGLAANTLKIGIMDEERRTSVNLKACIAVAAKRVVFINTGFLDRTGDEIHTSMHLGPFARKADIKTEPWLDAYEKRNVSIGLACGLGGKAQIGKGMWPMPDLMQGMLEAKIGHPQAGANTAWVPSPTAATLHALHYHQIDVFARQSALSQESSEGLKRLLQIPLLEQELVPEDIQQELDNNVQGILGYVVRWVHMGIGCSKVPDLQGVGLMEDRATLRISSQHIANWLVHGLVSEAQVNASLHKMAALVDEQNSGDNAYIPMGAQPQQSLAFQAAADLIFKGVEQPSGYTEPLLHAYRRQMKAQTQQHSECA